MVRLIRWWVESAVLDQTGWSRIFLKGLLVGCWWLLLSLVVVVVSLAVVLVVWTESELTRSS